MPRTATSSPLEGEYTPGAGFEDTAQTAAEQDAELRGSGDGDVVEEQEAQQEDVGVTEADLIRLARGARQQAVTFAQRNFQAARDQSYRAFRSEFIPGSKYKSDDYAGRSKIFRPKTKIAVTKDLAGFAQTLFANVEPLSIEPGDPTDDIQAANAELMHELVKYRLDRTSRTNAIPWFLTAMGARQDAGIAGICCSKQYWDYAERTVTVRDEATGQPVTTTKKLKDKPAVDLIAPENVGLDPAALWLDPVNSGAYFYVKYPMHRQDVLDRMKDPRVPWRMVPDTDEDKEKKTTGLDRAFSMARVEQFEDSTTRRSREGGQDRMDNSDSTAKEFDVVWVYDWYIRFADEDWNFWTLGPDHMLSDPVPTEEAYPWKGGLRPYNIGLGNLEAHRIVPQSVVECLQGLQNEINDVTNLRLDLLKQVIQPTALVKRGQKVDTDAIKRRYPLLFVNNPKEDIVWDRPPPAGAEAFQETSRLDTDFDDLAGVFSGGSVASNRQVGETVGGMKLMAGSSNAVTEFYTRLLVETWVEPVLADLAKLEAYYESDEKIMAICRKRAPAMQAFGDSELTDEFLQQEVLVRVSAGVGSHDPMQKSARLSQAFLQLEGVVKVSKKFASGEIKVKEEPFINEILGNAGYRDGFDRFFEIGEADPVPGEQPNPDADPAVLADNKAERDNKMGIAQLNAKTSIAKELITMKGEHQQAHKDWKHEGKHKYVDTMLEIAGHQEAAKERAARPPPGAGGGGGGGGARPQPAAAPAPAPAPQGLPPEL